MAWEALGSAPPSWSDVLAPPEELTAFLASIKVLQHAAVLADLGYSFNLSKIRSSVLLHTTTAQLGSQSSSTTIYHPDTDAEALRPPTLRVCMCCEHTCEYQAILTIQVNYNDAAHVPDGPRQPTAPNQGRNY